MTKTIRACPHEWCFFIALIADVEEDGHTGLRMEKRHPEQTDAEAELACEDLVCDGCQLAICEYFNIAQEELSKLVGCDNCD
ncbi:MAG: hypothetical protein ABIE42_05790 [Candidatus Eisenbacteria bacterium]